MIPEFIRENSFGILISSVDGRSIQDTHTPFLATDDGAYLLGHIARANGHWRDWGKNSGVKVIFHGPHCYVSPTFYESETHVPIWNYTAVSVAGEIEFVSDYDEQKTFMHTLVKANESAFTDPWFQDESNDNLMKLFSAVVFFKTRITKIEAKFKLNQNKSKEVQESVRKKLSVSQSPFEQSVARLMGD